MLLLCELPLPTCHDHTLDQAQEVKLIAAA